MWLYKRHRFFFRFLTKWQWWYWNTKFDWKWFSWCWLIMGNGHQSVQFVAFCFSFQLASVCCWHTQTHMLMTLSIHCCDFVVFVRWFTRTQTLSIQNKHPHCRLPNSYLLVRWTEDDSFVVFLRLKDWNQWSILCTLNRCANALASHPVSGGDIFAVCEKNEQSKNIIIKQINNENKTCWLWSMQNSDLCKINEIALCQFESYTCYKQTTASFDNRFNVLVAFILLQRYSRWTRSFADENGGWRAPKIMIMNIRLHLWSVSLHFGLFKNIVLVNSQERKNSKKAKLFSNFFIIQMWWLLIRECCSFITTV